MPERYETPALNGDNNIRDGSDGGGGEDDSALRAAPSGRAARGNAFADARIEPGPQLHPSRTEREMAAQLCGGDKIRDGVMVVVGKDSNLRRR